MVIASQYGVIVQHLLLLTLGLQLGSSGLLLEQQLDGLAPLLGFEPLGTALGQRLAHLQHPFILLGRRIFQLVDEGVILAVLLGRDPLQAAIRPLLVIDLAVLVEGVLLIHEQLEILLGLGQRHGGLLFGLQ